MILDKPALRARMRAERDRFAASSEARVVAPQAFIDRLRPDSVVASYHPIGSEADPVALNRAVLDKGATLALPHTEDQVTPIRFLAWHPDHGLAQGPYGLRQPHPDGEEVTPDIVLTPLVAFDDAGNRLGQGAGHYDRAFAALPDAWRLGVAWSVQQVDHLPADDWDIPLHAIVTERGLITREQA